MTYGFRLEDQDGVSILTLNRPEKLNALNYETIDCLMGALDDIEKDPQIRAVILTGSGDRAFCAGADIPEFADSIAVGVDVALREFVRRGQNFTRRVESFPKPVIVAVNGLAFGAGCEVTEAAPLAIASERATFAKPEILRGFPPCFGGTQRLPRLIGRKRALRMILTAESIDAAEAARLGLVNEVVPHEQLLDAALALAKSIAKQGPLAVQTCLAAVTRGLNLTIDEGLAVEAAQFGMMVGTRDIEAGLASFLDRRVPRYAAQ